MSDICTHFEIRHGGMGAILLDDPTFVRAEAVMVTRHNREAFALLHQKLHSLGEVPQDIMAAFCENRDVMLRATRVDGSVLEMRSHLVLAS